MSEGEFKKRKITALDAEYLVKLGEFKVSDFWDPMKLVEDAKKEFPKERLGYCDIAEPDKGRCWVEPSHEEYQKWFVHWFGVVDNKKELGVADNK